MFVLVVLRYIVFEYRVFETKIPRHVTFREISLQTDYRAHKKYDRKSLLQRPRLHRLGHGYYIVLVGTMMHTHFFDEVPRV